MRLIKPVVGALVLVGLYAAAGYVGVPAAVRWAVGNAVPDALGGRGAEVGDVSFNPWTWELSVKDLVVHSANKPENHVLKLAGLSTKVSFSTLTELAPVVDFITVERLDMVLTANETNNQETAQATEKAQGDTASGLPAFSLSNVRVIDSAVRFTNPKAGAAVDLTDINFELPVVSTLPQAAGGTVAPKLSLKIDGTPVAAEGRLAGETAQLSLNIAELDAAKLLKALPVTIGYNVQSAKLTTVLDVAFTMPKGGAASVSAKGTVQIKNVDVRTAANKPFVSVKTLSTEIGGFDLAAKRADITRVEIINPTVTAEIDSGIAKKPAASGGAAAGTPASTATGAAGGWNWSIGSAEISNGSVKISDAGVKPAAALSVTAVHLKAKGFSSANGAKGSYSASAKVAGGFLSSEGTLALAPLAVSATTHVKTLPFAPFNPWVKAIAGAQFAKGSADITGKLDYAAGKTSRIAWNGDFAVDNLEAKNARGKTLMTWKEVSANKVNLASVDPVNLSVGRLQVKEPVQKVTQTANKILGLLGAIASATGHDNTAKRAQKANEVISQDIVLENLVYRNGRFSCSATDALQRLVLEALNGVFAKASGGAEPAADK